MAIAKKPANTICRQKFIEWALKNRIIATEDDDFEDEPAWLSWKSSWTVSNLITRNAVRREYRQYNQPLSDEEIKDLWNHCSGGKSFARMIEYKHGIKE